MERGALLPCGDCVPGRGATAWLTDEPAVPSRALDWSVWIVTVRIFFGPGAAGMPGVAGATVETDGVAAGGEAWPAFGFDAVVAGIAGAGGAGGGVDIAGLLDDGPAE
jgi:hypothetical protein